MKINTTNYSNINDLVFENRNISYGAYVLRQKYEKHLYTGLLVTFGIFALGMGIPEYLKKLRPSETTSNIRETTVNVLDQPPPLTPAVPPPAMNIPQPPPPPVTSFIPTVTDQIVPDIEDVFVNNIPAPPPVIHPGDQAGNYVFHSTDFAATEPNNTDKSNEPDTFYKVEQMPVFDGNLAEFLQKNIKYPEQAERIGVEGRVYVSFIVAADGSIQNIKVIRGVFKALDEEAERVIRKMPNWRPGKQSGRAVAVHYTLPISFKLNN